MRDDKLVDKGAVAPGRAVGSPTSRVHFTLLVFAAVAMFAAVAGAIGFAIWLVLGR